MPAWLSWKAAQGLFGSIRPKVWLALGCAVALVLGVLWHRHAEHKALAAAEQAGEAKAYANVATQAKALTDKANALNAQISQALRSKTDETIADVHATAADVRMRGPGAASCSRVPGLAAATGGHIANHAKPDVAGPAVLADDRAGVSWNWLTDRAEEHDTLLAEDQAWRTWYSTYAAQWTKWNAAAAKARSAPPK